jgi:YgiT-type zinc finger domain-containing protein
MPYLKVQGEMLVHVPDMPVWVCDICGFYEYEREALTRLDNLMSGGKAAPRARGPKSPSNRTSRRVKP